MLLRASGEAIGTDVSLEGAVGPTLEQDDGGVPHGAALARFAEAATRRNEDLEEARRALLEQVGPAGFVEAAATVAIFNGLVRVADSTGIPLDEGTQRNSAAFRERLGLDAFGGARNRDLDGDLERSAPEPAPEADVGKLFSWK
jgi:hypothetical protein